MTAPELKAATSPPALSLEGVEVVYVDLDGTLSPTDLLVEACLQLLRKQAWMVFALVWWALQGGWRLKTEVARRVILDVTGLPIRPEVMAALEGWKAQGKRLVLASASLQVDVERVAQQAGVFDAVLASTTHNLKGRRKLEAMQHDAAGRPFAYLGDAAVDLRIWPHCQAAVAVNASRSTQLKAKALGVNLQVLPVQGGLLRGLRKAMRLQQWSKNALLFLPLIAAHQGLGPGWLQGLWAFVAFGLVASGTYVWNDLMDLPSDRRHPRKRLRPMASGAVPPHVAVAWMLLLVLGGFALSAWALGLLFTAVLSLYTASTLLYTFVLKRVAFVDVLMLAMLYTLRVIAGGVATGIEVSSWLLAISLFVFLSLALVKRCAELEFLQAEGADTPAGRGYQMSDLSYLVSMGISSGFMAVMVLALYVDSQNGSLLYSNPRVLWLICPILLYWLMRIWILTSRRQMVDDPVHFAIHDKLSWVCLAGIGLVSLAAN